ncbi:hypothetical protein F0562_013063 [Nyssa sinensis]|uniref:Growth-regulating factor n=1 Tax=Nyssa sinensis TaxID=561372 RepID=A0A5J4ZXN5_9ASTE|nr:hypothetical protein F0562_013063 [Nyssa sinensis]
MDFGVVSLEGLVSPENGVSSQVASDAEAKRPKSNGSGFLKQERSGSGEDEWRSSKMARTDGFDCPKTMLHQQGTLLRSNSLLSGDGGQNQNMLSFSSPKSEVTFLSKSGGLAGRSTQNPAFPYYQHTPYAYTRNAGYGSGGIIAGMDGPFPGIRGPFTPSQWIELEHQALIYKYIMANVPVPSNLLIAFKRSLNPFSFSGSPSGSYAPNSLGWGSFHLGFSGNTDPEPGRCRRTDGKKWRCSRDAVADQKYCERHMNRGRHRSRKPVEGQTGHDISGSTTSKVAPIASSTSASVMSGSGASNNLNITQHHFKGSQPGATNPSTNALLDRMQDPQGLSGITPTINLKSKDSPFSMKQHNHPFEESSQSEFGLVSSDSLLNPSQKSSYMNSRNYNSFLDFNDQETHDRHPLRHFIDDWPKDQSTRDTIAWPEELKSDWTQLSMSIPMATNFSSTSSSPGQDKLALSPLRLSCEVDPIQMGLGGSHDLGEPTQKQTNFIPISWASSMGGPLGEVLKRTSSSMGACKNSSTLNLMTEVWDGSPQLGSSPTGVLQKTTFVSLSNSSSGSSPRADNMKTNENTKMSYRKVHLQGNVPFSWEDIPGVPKVIQQECPTDMRLNALILSPEPKSSPSHSDDCPLMMSHDQKIPPPPCPFQPLLRRSSRTKGLGQQDDPFLAAFRECTKSVASGKMPGESKNIGVVSKVRKSKFIFSCKQSSDVEDEDPFLTAFKECTEESVRIDKMAGESKNGNVVSKVRKSKFIFSCKHSCDVEDDNLVRLANLPPPRERYRD